MIDGTDSVGMTAAELVAATTGGLVSAEAATAARLQRVAAQDPTVGSIAHIDDRLAMRAAGALDAARKSGRPTGRLHGLAVGVKDIIDTSDLPTENGALGDRGRRVRQDATLVRRLRAAGAIVFAKTVTTELAYFSPSELAGAYSGHCANPHDVSRTPGGSSSGSAAAVAAGLLPAAIGTQTNGSVIRPASFCGVVGYKPSYGLIPRTGVLPASRSLDQVGVFARTVEDAAMVAEVMIGADGVDPLATEAAGALRGVTMTPPPVRPMLAFIKTAAWARAEPSTHDAFSELVDALGDGVDEVPLPTAFDDASARHRAIMAAEMAHGLGSYADAGDDAVSAAFRELVDDGRSVSATDYLAALDRRAMLNAGLDEIFERYDAIITPATLGEAPKGLKQTGDPAFCTLWSYCGTPAISLPLMTGPSGLPLGVQLIGPRGDDARLLRTARWLISHLSEEEASA